MPDIRMICSADRIFDVIDIARKRPYANRTDLDQTTCTSVLSVQSLSCKHVQSVNPGSEVMKKIPCSAQLSIKFQMLISIEMPRNSTIFRFI